MLKRVNKLIVENFFHPIYKEKVADFICNLCDENSFILDFGCGNGVVSQLILEKKSNLKITGTDLKNRNCKIDKRSI